MSIAFESTGERFDSNHRIRGKMGTSCAQENENINKIREIEKKELKSLVSKEFTCPVSYFERFANLMSQEVRHAHMPSVIF